jgi:hypothetical protein
VKKNFETYFPEVFPKFELEKRVSKFFSKAKLKYFGIEKICKGWGENVSLKKIFILGINRRLEPPYVWANLALGIVPVNMFNIIDFS